MKEKKVIARSNLPTKLPLCPTMCAYLMLDRFEASDLICGGVATLFCIVWILVIYSVCTEKQKDVINNERSSDGADREE
jgi:hypothetical protein